MMRSCMDWQQHRQVQPEGCGNAAMHGNTARRGIGIQLCILPAAAAMPYQYRMRITALLVCYYSLYRCPIYK